MDRRPSEVQPNAEIKAFLGGDTPIVVCFKDGVQKSVDSGAQSKDGLAALLSGMAAGRSAIAASSPGDAVAGRPAPVQGLDENAPVLSFLRKHDQLWNAGIGQPPVQAPGRGDQPAVLFKSGEEQMIYYPAGQGGGGGLI